MIFIGKEDYGAIPKNIVPPMQIKKSQGNLQQVRQLDTKKGWKGLGIVSTPNGTWIYQMTYLLIKKLQPWKKTNKSTYLFKHNVYQSAINSILKYIEYTLPATSLTSTQCKTINTNQHIICIPRKGINIHMQLVYRYSPYKY